MRREEAIQKLVQQRFDDMDRSGTIEIFVRDVLRFGWIGFEAGSDEFLSAFFSESFGVEVIVESRKPTRKRSQKKNTRQFRRLS
jgi:hypothetical protein